MRRHFKNDASDSLFVARICVSIKEADRDRFHAFVKKVSNNPLHLIRIRWFKDLASMVHALVDREAKIAGDERFRLLPLEVVELVAVGALNLEDVAKSSGRYEPDFRARPLDDEVRDQRRPVKEMGYVTQVYVALGHRLEKTFLRRPWGRRGLGALHRSGRLIQHNQVGEGAADVDTDTFHLVLL